MKNIRYISYGFAVSLLVTGLSAQTAPPPPPSASDTTTTTTTTTTTEASAADQTSTTASGDTVKLPSFQVNDTSDKGYLAANSVSATKIATRIADLPFAVSAFTPQFIADTGAQNIQDIVQYAAGVSNGSNGYVFAADFYVRGFLQYPETNGFYEGSNGNNYVDSANIERVEVVKGPASLLYGQIQPGGTVNYITKSPQPKAFQSVQVEFGSYNYGRVTVDVNQPIMQDKLSFRFVGSYEGDFQFVQPGRDVQSVLAPSVKWNITPELSVIARYQGYRNDANPQVFLRPQMELETPASMVASINGSTTGYPGFSQLLNGKIGIDAQQGYPSDGADYGFLNSYPRFPWNENVTSNDDYEHTQEDSLNIEIDLNAGAHWTVRGDVDIDHEAYTYLQSSSGHAAMAPPGSLQYSGATNTWSVAPAWSTATTAQQLAWGYSFAQQLNNNPNGASAQLQNGTPPPVLYLGNAQYDWHKANTYSDEVEAAGDYTFSWGSVKPLFGVYDDGGGAYVGSASTLGTAADPNHQVWDIDPYSPTYYVNHNYQSPLSTLNNVSPTTWAWTSDQAVYGIVNAALFDDRLYIVGGVRYNRSESLTETLGGVIGQGFEASYTTPQAGFGFKITKDVMLYANYSTADQLPGSSFLTNIQPVNGVLQAVQGAQAAVQQGTGYEAGIKTTLDNDRISGYVAVYTITEKNVVQSAGVVEPTGQTLNVTFDQTQIRSRGVEAEITYTPIDNWQIFASGSEDDCRYTVEPLGELIFVGQGQPYFTKTLANLWTRYSFVQPDLKGLWIAGGCVYHGKEYQDMAAPGYTWPSYPLWNASIGDDFTFAHIPMNLMLNGQNLNNVTYNIASQFRGLPRRVVVSLKATF